MAFVDRLETDITLDDVKSWCKVEHELENELLGDLKTVAIHDTYNFLQNDFEHENELGEIVEDAIPLPVIQAIKYRILYLFTNRGDETLHLDNVCRSLLNPYRKWVGT